MSKILIVDDEPDVVMLLQAVFAAAGHVAHTLSHPKDALSTILALRPEVLVLDLSMPEKSGWEVLEEVRKARDTAELPVVVVSASSSLDDRVRAFREGADDFVVKPFLGDELVARVERIIRRHQLEQKIQLRGRLEGMPLSQVLQSLENSRSSGTLRLSTTLGEGLLSLVGGKLQGASYGRLSGTEALWALLETTHGSFDLREQPGESSAQGTLGMGLHSAMLEAAWIEDELAARIRFLPAAADHLEPTNLAALNPLPDDLASLPIGWLLEQSRQSPRRTFGELLSAAPAAPSRVRFTAAWLVEQGYLVIHPAATPDVQATSASEALPIRSILSPGQPLPRNQREPLVSVIFDPLAVDVVAECLGFSPGHSPEGAGLEVPHRERIVRLQLLGNTLEAVDRIFDQCSRSEIVVLWIGPHPNALKVPPRLLQAAAGREAKLWLIASPSTPRGELDRALGASSRWLRLEQKVDSAAELVSKLLGGDYEVNAQHVLASPLRQAEG